MPQWTLTPEHIFAPHNDALSSVLPLVLPSPISPHLSLCLPSVFNIYFGQSVQPDVGREPSHEFTSAERYCMS